jgi:nucleoside diphosphate kinase
VTRWFLTLVNQPEVKRIVGDVALCSKAATFDAKAFAEFNKGQKKPGTTSGKQEGPAIEVSYEYDAKSKERTFIMVKPDGVQRGLVGEIIDRFETRGGLKLVAMKFMQASIDHMKLHYADLSSKPFFNGMVEYMASSPVVPMVWEGLNAAKIGRMLLGETDPQKSLPGSIRGDFCLDIGRNLIHGSDSPESAKKEIELWFGDDITIWTTANQFNVYEPSKIIKSKADKKDAPKKEAKKEEKKDKSKTEADIAEAMEEEAPPKKEKDPFAGFPKSSFNLDEFKRVYSNEDIKTKAIPYFWENFDSENFSIWLCEYQFPEDLGMTFQSENLITGMYQRLDKLNKNAFASVGLFGKSRNSQIQGIWIWRGSELAFKLSDNWQIDYESYDWTRLDASAPATRQLVDEFLLREEDVMTYKPHKASVYDKYSGLTLYSANVFK